MVLAAVTYVDDEGAGDGGSVVEEAPADPDRGDSTSGADPPESGQIADATCRDEQGETSCDGAHSIEIAHFDPCTRAGLITYMGGDADVDVVQDLFSVSSSDDACRVEVVGQPVDQSLSGILREPEGDVYRLCWDKSTDAAVGCNEPHFAEKIYAGGATSVDCNEMYSRYVGVPLDRHFESIDLERDAGDTTSCWAKVRLNAQLVGSLRSLGERSLPLE